VAVQFGRLTREIQGDAMQDMSTIDAVQQMLAAEGYVCDRALGTVVFLSLKLGRPLFLEGEAGVGKTEIAKALASGLGRRLIRLQCYEGLDAASAVYEWNFPAQMVAIRTAEATGSAEREALQNHLFSDDYLIERPLLQAMRPDENGAPVLLIDELDRTDEPFEAFLLEALSDFQVTIPELGTIHAPDPPIVIVTSNRTREVHDALKRRCLYHWVDYPGFDREMEILEARAPEAAETLSREVVAFVQRLRTEDLFKKPGVAETIDWAKCLLALDVITLSPEVIADTLGAILKYQDDIQKLHGSEAKRILDEAKATLEPA
jgi:MoxR-like ATPase